MITSKNKLFYFHFNVASGLEHGGNEFEKWLIESDYNIHVEKIQGQPWEQIDKLIKFKPDIIVANETYKKSLEAILYYKKFHQNVKVIILSYIWGYLFDRPHEKTNNPGKIYRIQRTSLFRRTAEQSNTYTIGLDWKPADVNLHLKNYFTFYPPISDDFKIIKPWNKRKMFAYFGNVNERKFCFEFAKKSDIEIDVFGNKTNFDIYPYKSKYMKYKGFVKHSGMPEVLNQYKYFIMPHKGRDGLPLSLIQSMKCGTIPVISTLNEENWTEFAKDLYFGVRTVDNLITNLKKLEKEDPDLTIISNDISKRASERFNYNKIKKCFMMLLEA